MHEGKSKNSRNPNIELLRVIACVMVIIRHTLTATFGINEVLVDIIRSFTMSAVGIFWIITGFYLFRGSKSYVRKVFDTLKNIFLPALVVMMVSQFLLDWLNCERSLWECISEPKFYLRYIFSRVLNWSIDLPLIGHLWYVYAYLRLIIWFPILNFLCKNEEKANLVRRSYLVVFFIRAVVYDLQYIVLPFIGFNRGITLFLPFDENIFYVLLGYELSIVLSRKEAEREGKRKMVTNAIFMVFISCVLTFLSIRLCKYLKISEGSFTAIKSGFVILASVSVFYLGMRIEINQKIHKIIVYLGDKTFYAYLIHFMVLRKIIKSRILVSDYRFLQFVISVIVITCLTFVLAIVIKRMQKSVLNYGKKFQNYYTERKERHG